MADRFDDMKFWQFESICHANGLVDPSERIENLLRVLKTREAATEEDAQNPENLYKVMQSSAKDLPRFKGDADLFSQIYSSLCSVGTHDILSFIARANQNDRGRITVPDVLTEKFAEYISSNTETVFVPECEEYGVALLDVIESHPDVHFTLSSRNAYWTEILRYVYGPCENVTLSYADIYTDGFNNERYDLIFCVPVFGARSMAEGQDFICKDSDMIAVQNLLYHVGIDGHLVIILPAKITFGSGSIAALREYIQSNYAIKEISIMPAGLFSPWTMIRTYMFCFGNGSTEDVLVRKYESGKPSRRVGPCEELSIAGEEILFPDEFADLNGWNVDMAFMDEDDDLRAYNQSSVKKTLLKDVATIFRGKAVNNKTEVGTIGVVNISNLTLSGIDYGSLEMLDEEERKVARYILKDGDVLVASRGTTTKVAVFEQQDMTCIPSANLIVIRLDERLRGAYLKIFLESQVGVKLMKGLQRGALVMNINYKDMGDLEVPLPSLEEQDEIISDYNDGLNLYQQTIAAAEEAWAGVQKEIQSRLY